MRYLSWMSWPGWSMGRELECNAPASTSKGRQLAVLVCVPFTFRRFTYTRRTRDPPLSHGRTRRPEPRLAGADHRAAHAERAAHASALGADRLVLRIRLYDLPTDPRH